MANGKWQMANGKWQMANGKWQMANGKWQKLPIQNGKSCKLYMLQGKVSKALLTFPCRVYGKKTFVNGKMAKLPFGMAKLPR